MHYFDFVKEYTLENEDVTLMPLHLEDLEDLKHFALDEPELWQFSQEPVGGLENLESYIRKAELSRKEKTTYPFIVYDNRVEKYAGSTRFYDYQPYYKTVQIGYTWYGKEFQGTGINKQCKFLMLDFAFGTMMVERVEFRADALNERSIAAMKSIGCKVEGVLRHNRLGPSGRRDSIILSILKEEWNGGGKEALLEKIEKEKNNVSL